MYKKPARAHISTETKSADFSRRKQEERNVNQWSGIGNLCRGPEASVSQSGTDICKFTIAVNRAKDANGQSQTDFIPVRAFGRRAALCREYLRKGRKVGIIGKLQTYSYTTQDGQKRNGFEILLDDITFLPSGDPNKTQFGDVHSDDGVVHHDVGTNDGFIEVYDEELPF